MCRAGGKNQLTSVVDFGENRAMALNGLSGWARRNAIYRFHPGEDAFRLDLTKQAKRPE